MINNIVQRIAIPQNPKQCEFVHHGIYFIFLHGPWNPVLYTGQIKRNHNKHNPEIHLATVEKTTAQAGIDYLHSDRDNQLTSSTSASSSSTSPKPSSPKPPPWSEPASWGATPTS